MRKTIFIILPFIFSVSCTENKELRVQQQVDCVDIIYYPNHHVILVPVIINGIKTYFSLDTGAPTSIDVDIFNTLNLDSIEYHTGYDYYGNKKDVVKTIIPSIIIGNTEYKNKKISVLDVFQFESCGPKLGGFLGSDFFTDKIVQIDVSKKQMLIANSTHNIDVDGHYKQGLNIKYGQKSPFVFINIPTIKFAIEAEFDIGSHADYLVINYNVFNKLIDKGYIHKDKILDTLDESDNGAGLFGKQKDTLNFKIKIDSVFICGAKLYNCPVRTANIDFPRIGAPLLKQGIVTIDFINKQFYFKSFPNSIIDRSRNLGFSFDYNDQGYKITSVKKGSKVAMSGIKIGYDLIEFCSVNLDSISYCEFLMTDWEMILAEEEKVKMIFKSPDGKMIEQEVVY